MRGDDETDRRPRLAAGGRETDLQPITEAGEGPERDSPPLPPARRGRERSASPPGGRASASPPIDGIVLAAGRSRRLGRPKPLLPIPLGPAEGGRKRGANDGETFLERAVHRLAAGGCRSITVVVAAGNDPIRRLARALGTTIVENEEPDSEPIDSVRLAIASLPPDSAAAVVLPVDVPLIASSTVAAVVEAFATRGTPIVAPSYRGELGHPVLIARPLFRSVMTEPLEQGLRSLLESRADHIEAVPVDDPGTLIDIDTPEEYEKLIARHDQTFQVP